MNRSNGLIFPVLWNEPMGLAVIESLYYGCPVFATPYGSLPQLVPNEVGFLSDKKSDLVAAIKANDFDPRICHEYARDLFNNRVMAENYLKCFEKVLGGETLNPSAPVLKQIPSKVLFPMHA